MSSANLGRVALYVELDGKPHLVALSEQAQRMLVHLAGSLCEGGQLRVLPAPGVTFQEVPVNPQPAPDLRPNPETRAHG